MRKTRKVGSIVAGLNDSILLPHDLNLERPPVVYGHGAADDGWAPCGAGSYPEVTLCDYFSRAGFTLVCPTETYLLGNDTACAPTTGRHPLAVAYARASGRCSATKKAGLIGGSQGAFHAMKTIALDPTNYMWAVCLLPPPSMQVLRVNNTLSLRANIDTAAGVTYPAALPAGYDILGNSTYIANLATVPGMFWVSDNDEVSYGTVGNPIDFAAFAASIGWEVHSLGAVGHSFGGLVNGVDPKIAVYPLIMDFVEAHTT